MGARAVPAQATGGAAPVGAGDTDTVERRSGGAGPHVDAREMEGKTTAATGARRLCFPGKHLG